MLVVYLVPAAAAPTAVTSLGGILTTGAAALAGAVGAKNYQIKSKEVKRRIKRKIKVVVEEKNIKNDEKN